MPNAKILQHNNNKCFLKITIIIKFYILKKNICISHVDILG